MQGGLGWGNEAGAAPSNSLPGGGVRSECGAGTWGACVGMMAQAREAMTKGLRAAAERGDAGAVAAMLAAGGGEPRGQGR